MNSTPEGTPASPLDPATRRASELYGFAQTAILILFAAVVFLSPKAYLFISPAAFTVGSVFCGLGILVMLPALAALRGTIQIAPEPKAGKQLVERGVYRYLRHPIYTGIILCAAGFFLRQPTLWVAVASAVVIVFLAVKVRFEEKLLQATYPGYAEYRRRAWGLFPGFRY